MDTYSDYINRDYAASDATDNFKRRNSTFNKFKRTMGGYGTSAGRKFDSATSGVKSATAPLRETLKNSVTKFNNQGVWGKTKTIGKFGQGVATPVFEGIQTYNDLETGSLSEHEKKQRLGETGVRLSAAGIGATVGGPIGAAVGYITPDVAEYLNNALGGDYKLPSTKAEDRREAKTSTPEVTQTGQSNADGAADKNKSLEALKETLQKVTPNAPTLVNNQPWKTKAPAPQPLGNETINNSQQQVNTALAQLAEILKAPADAETIGDAVAQKSRNKTAMELLRATLQATGANNQGQIDQSRISQSDQGIVASKQGQKVTDQKLKLGQFDIDQKQQLADTMKQFQAAEGSEKNALRNTLLTMMGKQPDSPYKFMKINEGANGEQIFRVNTQTGQIEGGQQTALPEYKDGQTIDFSDGKKMIWDAKLKRAVDPTQV